MGLGNYIRALFRLAGVRPLFPHKFRHGHAVYCMQYAKDDGDIKALSMNLMHSNTGITDGIYAVLSDKDTHDRISSLGGLVQSTNQAEGLKKAEVIAKLRDLMAQLENL